ncbi:MULTISPECIES: hypothetical protein [unclassified Microbacterium]|uniref:hypothetical protein n=1 Tax=Microbacterium TaxID=33882 RepID=UPI003B9F8A25
MPAIGVVLLDPHPLGPAQILACVLADVPLWQVQDTARGVVTSLRWAGWPRTQIPGHTLPVHACARVWAGLPPLELSLDTAETPSPASCPF